MKRRVTILFVLVASMGAGHLSLRQSSIIEAVTAQTRRPKRTLKSPATRPPAPQGSAAKYSNFLHSSETHKGLSCNACHKVPTAWTAKRNFPDVADFPDHDACVRCHRQQFFTRQAFAGTGPTICTVCHVRAAPREDGRFAFGNPNSAGQPRKSKDERQFTIEFPHDKHQNVIALLRRSPWTDEHARFLRVSFFPAKSRSGDQKADYNNCSICHRTNAAAVTTPPTGWPDAFVPPAGTFKTQPAAHDACFECHWKSQKPAGDNCVGCHKLSAAFTPIDWPKRISAKFSHEGGKGEHVLECTTCHINITRASTVRGLTPDVPITICATCHKDNKKTTYPKMTTIEEEFEQAKKTGNCLYCHTSDVGNKKPPSSHDASIR